LNQKIKLLDQHSINQIAAGEVVERPLSVVKELIENSLDAEARKIDIRVEGGGTSLITVKDDGYGIEPKDLRLAILPHATSKINSILDLENLESLGFRGEALPSIASVSKLSILSRTSKEVAGYRIQVEGGVFISGTETGCPYGTTVTVKDLFFNTPARRKFLRSNSTEFGLISDMISRLALARPDVSFNLRHPNNLVLNTPGKGDLLETIAALLGNNTARQMLPITYQNEHLKVNGYISKPEMVRSSINGVTFIVNGRVIRSQLLNQALKRGYHTFIHQGTYPVSVLTITMPPSNYDVNIHPAKLEIKFKDEKEIADTITKIIRIALLTDKPIRNISLNTKGKPPQINKSIKNANNNWNQLKILYKPFTQSNNNKKITHGRVNILGGNNVETIAESNFIAGYTETVSQKLTMTFQELRALEQLFNTYIISTDEKSLYLIDQHAAHERIRYDKLNQQLKKNKMSSQLLLVPETVELTIQEENILIEFFEKLHEMGFIIEHFGGRSYFLRGVPIFHNLENPGKLFRMFLDGILTNLIPPSLEKLLEEWIFMLACRTAIKSKEKLSIQEMDELIQELGNCDNPFSCPHGRPTIIKIPKQELDKRFER
jgi:DNA mismatch repair protein MutL